MMKIIPAKQEYAPLIGRAVTMAIGDELTLQLAGDAHTAADVEALFTSLARRDDTQYSYRNTLAAVDEVTGEVMGLVVGYDGAGLVAMRRVFFAEAAEQIGMVVEGDPDSIPGETSDDEFYLDTLAVFPAFRGRGVARALIGALRERAKKTGKPVGLLVDTGNHRARALYESVGFRQVGEREFAGELMDHMLIDDK